MTLKKFRMVDLFILLCLGMLGESIAIYFFGSINVNGCIQFATIAILVIAVTRWRAVGFITLPIMLFVPYAIFGFGINNLIVLLVSGVGISTAGVFVLSYKRMYEKKYTGLINPLILVVTASLSMVVTRGLAESLLYGNLFTYIRAALGGNLLGVLTNFIFVKIANSQSMLMDVKDYFLQKKEEKYEEKGI